MKRSSSMLSLNSKEESPQKNYQKHNYNEPNKQIDIDQSEFLNVRRFQRLKIYNKKIRSLVKDCKNLGPYYSKCNVCNNKNVAYFNEMGMQEAEKITDFIRKATKFPDQ